MSDENLPAKNHEIPLPLPGKQKGNDPGAIGRIHAETFSGPLPPPGLLGQYEDICPGSADRIIKMAEQEAEHRRSIEHSLVQFEANESARDSVEARRGQVCALLIALTALGISGYTAMAGHEIAASIIGVGGLGSIITSFLIRKVPPDQPPPVPPKPAGKAKRQK